MFGLMGIIELERPSNPQPPAEVAADYFRAIAAVPEVVGSHPDRSWDEVLTSAVVCCIALARGQRVLARAFLEMNLNHARTWLEEQGYAPEE